MRYSIGNLPREKFYQAWSKYYRRLLTEQGMEACDLALKTAITGVKTDMIKMQVNTKIIYNVNRYTKWELLRASGRVLGVLCQLLAMLHRWEQR